MLVKKSKIEVLPKKQISSNQAPLDLKDAIGASGDTTILRKDGNPLLGQKSTAVGPVSGSGAPGGVLPASAARICNPAGSLKVLQR